MNLLQYCFCFMSFLAMRHVDLSSPRNWTGTPCIGRWGLNHWITREVPRIAINTLGYEIWLARWLSGKESACHAGDWGSIPGLIRSAGEGNGNPLQCSYLESSMDRGAWWADKVKTGDRDETRGMECKIFPYFRRQVFHIQ